jgi:hypothetical protein
VPVRAMVGLANWFVRQVLRWQFRAFAHSHRAIDRVCAEEGLNLDRMIPACCGACGSTGGPPPDGYSKNNEKSPRAEETAGLDASREGVR